MMPRNSSPMIEKEILCTYQVKFRVNANKKINGINARKICLKTVIGKQCINTHHFLKVGHVKILK